MKMVKLTVIGFSRILSSAERVLRSGGIVIAPTDTVYGILGDATRPETIKKIFALKQRSAEKALPVFVKDVATARRIAYISDAKAKFLEKIWPGAVTVVFHHKEKLPKILTGGKDTIGIRIPNHEFILRLLGRVEFPLAQTSANISARPPAKNIKEIKEYFSKAKVKPDLIIDGGELPGSSSTAVDFTGNEPIILRIGPVTKEDLDRIIGSMRL